MASRRLELHAAIWQTLKETKIKHSEIKARRLMPELTDRVFAAIDSDEKRHILILLNKNDREFKEYTSRGLNAKTRLLKIGDQQEQRYIDLLCINSSAHNILDYMGVDLAEIFSKTQRDPARMVDLTITKWRNFWRQPYKNTLSKEEAAGLLGELLFLRDWLLPYIDHEVAVNSWTGPESQTNDFIFGNISTEVKTTLRLGYKKHWINGIHQLEVASDRELYMACYSLVNDPGSGLNLPAVIKDIEELVASSGILIHLNEKLLQAGYSKPHENEYIETTYKLSSEVLYIVNDDFPQITPASFKVRSLKAGIEDIKYLINLDSCDHLIMATSPSDKSWQKIVNNVL